MGSLNSLARLTVRCGWSPAAACSEMGGPPGPLCCAPLISPLKSVGPSGRARGLYVSLASCESGSQPSSISTPLPIAVASELDSKREGKGRRPPGQCRGALVLN